MYVTDPLGKPLGTVYAFVTLMLTGGWVFMQCLRYYKIYVEGVDIPLPSGFTELTIGAWTGYLGFRKMQNAQVVKNLAEVLGEKKPEPDDPFKHV